MAEKITAGDVRTLLRERFNDTRRYALATEVGNATGAEQARRLDMVAVDCYRSNGYSIEGIEIKVSKADLRRELQDSSKHNVFFDSLDYYSLAAPEDVIDMDLIPPKWGVYAVKRLPDGSLHMYAKRKPLSLHDEKQPVIDRAFAVCLMRALSCQSPTKAQLDEASELGRQKGWKQAEEEFARTRSSMEIERMREKLAAYEKLFEKCGFWGAGDIERGIEEFDRFRRVNLGGLHKRLLWMQEDIGRAIGAIEVGEVTKQDIDGRYEDDLR